jgi:hypothetical protein
MGDPASNPEPAAITAALASLERDHPCWHTWVGVGGLLYARRLKSSPPAVYRATDPCELEARIREHEGRQR